MMLALKSDGSLVSWGRNNYNQVSNTPAGNDFVAVAAGARHALALKSDGSIVERYSYDVFGKPTIQDADGVVLTKSDFDNKFMFTGREYNWITGNYYYRARYYSPKLGRFLQTDPIGYYGGLNLYAYVDNNPLNYIDPYGLWSIWGIIAGDPSWEPTPQQRQELGSVFAENYTRASQGAVNVFTGGLFDRKSGLFYDSFNRQWRNQRKADNRNNSAFKGGETGGRVAEAFLLAAAAVKATGMDVGIPLPFGGGKDSDKQCPKPPREYRYDDDHDHFNKKYQRDQRPHRNFRDYNWDGQQWRPGKWTPDDNWTPPGSLR